jgi:subtilisin family serine protease
VFTILSTGYTTNLSKEKEYQINTIEPIERITIAEELELPITYDPQLINESENANGDADVIVSFKSNNLNIKNNLDYLKKVFEFNIIKKIPLINGAVIRGPVSQWKAGIDPGNVKSFWLDKQVRTIQEEEEIYINLSSNEFVNFNREIEADKFHANGINGSNVAIAILDTGVNIFSGDLDDFDDNSSTNDIKFRGAVSLVPDDSFYFTDFNGRGTWLAGLATGTGSMNSTFVGVSPGASYLSVKIQGFLGEIPIYSSLVSGIEYAAFNGADIILLGAALPGFYLDPLSIAINEVTSRGILVVAPAGDSGPGYMSIDSPGQSLKALTVGGYDSLRGTVASFSSRGPTMDFRTNPDIIAPAVSLVGCSNRIALTGNETDADITTRFAEIGSFGRLVNENYTLASSTSGAASIVAGAAALLISEFPHATPEMIRIALISTATAVTGNPNDEGGGLFNLTAAEEYLLQYFESSSIDINAANSLSIYPGMILCNDSQGLNLDESRDNNEDWQAYNSALVFSTQTLGSIMIFNNNSGEDHPGQNYTAFHLPLLLFGIRYDSNLSLLIDYKILKEFHLVSDLSQGQLGYTRYAGALTDETLTVIIIAETFDYSIGLTNHLNAYKFTFTIINTSNEPVSNLSLVSYFKADCFVNETGFLSGSDSDADSGIGGIDSLDISMDFATDDTIIYNGSEQLIYVIDETNNTDFQYEDRFAAYGFNSTSHNLSAWEISPAIDLLGNLTEGKHLKNHSLYQQGIDDPGFAMEYSLGQKLEINERAVFEGVLGTGIGKNDTDTVESLKLQMNLVRGNTTAEDISEIMILKSNSKRTAFRGEPYRSTILAVNSGNTDFEELNMLFAANRTSQAQRIEVFATIENVKAISVWQLVNVSTEWIPVYEDTFAVMWAGIGGDDPQDLVFQGMALMAGFTSWNVYVVDRLKYQSLSLETAFVTPSRLNQEPYTVYFPGDIEFWNLTFLTIYPLQNVEIIVKGLHSDVLNLNWTSREVLNSYDTLSLNIVLPLVAAPGIYEITVKFLSNGQLFFQLPIKFVLKPLQGRMFFDGIHNDVTMNITNGGVNFDWDERLDTTFGNFQGFKSLCNSRTPVGASVQTLISGIDMGDSLGFGDLGSEDDNETSTETFFLPDTLKGYSFELDSISTDFLHTDLLQIFDVAILVDPEVAYTSEEIQNITKYVNKGGVLLVWCEGEEENDINSLKELLTAFNLTLGSQYNGSFSIQGILNDHALYEGVDSLVMQDPVNIIEITGTTTTNLERLNDYMVTLVYGKGRVFVTGDKDVFNNTGLELGDNKQLTINLVSWALQNDFPATVELKQGNKVKQGENLYIDVVIDDYFSYKPLLDAGSMFIYGFVAPDGSQINMFGDATISPFFSGEPGHYVARFNTSWSPNQSGLFSMLIYFDHSELVTEMFFVQFEVLPALPGQPNVPFEPEPPLYPHLVDFFILTAILYLIALQQAYRFFKYRRRYRFTILEEEIIFKARTLLSEIKVLNQSVTGVIDHTKYNEIEKVRFVLRTRRRINKALKDLRDFGSDIGEV